MNIGFLGCSKIGVKIIDALNSIPEVTLYGCSARNATKAKEYKEKYGFKHFYNTYEEMLDDPNIDLVYVSTLISSHYKDVMNVLKHNKPCLCEKAFTVTKEEAKELIDYSEKHNIYLGEAIWTRFMPYRHILMDEINKGVIGDVYMVNANLSYKLTDVERLLKKDMGGGIMLDLGIYPLNFAIMILGENYKEVNAKLLMIKEVDETMIVNLIYDNNVSANLTSSMNGQGDKRGRIFGTKGYIEIDNINNPSWLGVYYPETSDRVPTLQKEIHFNNKSNGYEYEFIETIECLKEGRIEPKSMTHKETLKIMELFENIRNSK